MNGQNLIVIPETKTGIPQEYTGRRRSDVKLLRIDRMKGSFEFGEFEAIFDLLNPGDVLVFNNSSLVPAHFRPYDREEEKFVDINIGYHEKGLIAEARSRQTNFHAGKRLYFADGSYISLSRRMKDYGRYWEIYPGNGFDFHRLSSTEGSYIIYDENMRYLPGSVYASEIARIPGSVEYPSASRPFTGLIMNRLKKNGIRTMEITLHCNLGSLDATEFYNKNHLLPEYFSVNADVAEELTYLSRNGSRIIAVGTTVVRALESARKGDKFYPAHGYTNIMIDGYRKTGINGLITGMHDPSTSHLLMLSNFVDIELIKASYSAAAESGFTWHEFGDSCIIL